MEVTFCSLYEQIHYRLLSYLTVPDIIAISQCNTLLQCIYRPLSFRECAVIGSYEIRDISGQGVRVENARKSAFLDNPHARPLVAQMLCDPNRYSWLLNNAIFRLNINPNVSYISKDILLWLAYYDIKEIMPSLQHIKLSVSMAWLEANSPSVHQSAFHRRLLNCLPKVSGVWLDSISSLYGFQTPSPLFTFITDIHISTSSLPPFQYLTSVKTFSFLQPDSLTFRVAITSIKTSCLNADTIKIMFDPRSEEDKINSDQCFHCLVDIPENIDIEIYFNNGIDFLRTEYPYIPTINQVKLISIPRKDYTDRVVTLICSSFPNLEVADISGLCYYISDMASLLPTGIGYSNLRSLKFSYTVNDFREKGYGFHQIAAHFTSLSKLEVAISKLSLDNFICEEFSSMVLRPASEIISDNGSFDEGDLTGLFNDLCESRSEPGSISSFSPSQVEKIKALLRDPMTLKTQIDREWLGNNTKKPEIVLDDIRLFEYFILSISKLPKLEYLFLKGLQIISPQLQLFINTSNIIKEIYFSNCVRYRGVAPIHDSLYKLGDKNGWIFIPNLEMYGDDILKYVRTGDFLLRR